MTSINLLIQTLSGCIVAAFVAVSVPLAGESPPLVQLVQKNTVKTKLNKKQRLEKEISDTNKEIGDIVEHNPLPEETVKEFKKAQRKSGRKLRRETQKIQDDWVEGQKFKLIKSSVKSLTEIERQRILRAIYTEADRRTAKLTDRLQTESYDTTFKIIRDAIAKTNSGDAAKLDKLKTRLDRAIRRYDRFHGGPRTSLKSTLLELPAPGSPTFKEEPKTSSTKDEKKKKPTKIVSPKGKPKTGGEKTTPPGGTKTTPSKTTKAGTGKAVTSEKQSSRFEPGEGLDNNSGGGCFTGVTLVRMANGSLRPIRTIVPGDQVVGLGGSVNRVKSVDRHDWGGRLLYSFNGTSPFITGNHPVLTAAGWMAVTPGNPRTPKHAGPQAGSLAVGAIAIVDRRGHAPNWTTAVPLKAASTAGAARAQVRLASMESVRALAGTVVYNLRLDGNHTYFANGFLVHNEK